MASLPQIIDGLRRRIGELERRQRSLSRIGVVAQVDAARGLARVRLQDGAQPFLTGWIPWQEPAAGANRTHNPPSVGQQVRIVSESGDLADASIQGSLNSDAHGRPSAAGDEYVLLSVGEARVSVTGSGAAIVLQVGAVTLSVTASGVAVTGGQVTHNGTDIGDTHRHGGVDSGPSQTEPPS